VLHGLEKNGALAVQRKTVGGRSRVYYSLTPRGLRRLDGLTEDWQQLSEAIGQVLKGRRHAPAL
jgi:PadR family transcriptional regulator PadR